MYSEARNQQGSTSGPTKKRLGTKERTNGANGLRRVYINRRLCLDVFLRGGRIKTHYDGTKLKCCVRTLWVYLLEIAWEKKPKKSPNLRSWGVLGCSPRKQLYACADLQVW
jgi:hypothetical protein